MFPSEKVTATMQKEYIRNIRMLVEKASEKNIQLRATGGIGVMAHCPNQMDFLRTMNRLPSDFDFIASSRQERKIDELFKDLGYTEKGGQGITMEVWTDRRIFEHPMLPHVDVFFDGLDFCHKIDFRKRLNIDSPTLSAADLMLGKLQIVEINEKDLQDLMALSLEHRLSEKDEPETINARYIADIMAQDWGFYFTAVTNLKKVKKLAASLHGRLLSDEMFRKAGAQIDDMIQYLDAAPKSFRWKARAKIGTKLRWYKNPGEEYREVAEG